MAKKKKQKKAGIAKRQQSKQQKKLAVKRKLQAKKTPQRRISPSKVKQNLKNLPSLVFEPEIERIAFKADDIERVQAGHDNVPDQIEAIATPDFMTQLTEACQALRIRFEEEGDTNKGMMVHAILYFMEQEEAPAFLNQIVVAMYYRSLHRLNHPDQEIDIKGLNQLLKEYDETWSDYLQEKMDSAGLTSLFQGEGALPSEAPAAATEAVEDEPTALLESPFEAVVSEFNEYLSSELSLDDESRERAVEDVEVLVNDYCEEKEITGLEELKARKVRNFLEGWFLRMMNPTREDMETMIDSLAQFFRFAVQTERISPETGDGISKLLEDRDALLAGFDA